ncbi:MAG: hypothetical protein AAFU67_08885, partial [Bacteroidota bacterium]
RFLKIIEQRILDLADVEKQIFLQTLSATQDTLATYQLYQTYTTTLMKRYGAGDTSVVTDLSQYLNSQAWYALLLGKFQAAEDALQQALQLPVDNKYLATNLAPALLLQGKQKAALAEFNKWKDRPFNETNFPTYREVFLDDLTTFKSLGIIPPERQKEVAEVIKLLRE